ncbi:hypothetical protein ACHAWF_010386 [Thalassiosira exigua]
MTPSRGNPDASKVVSPANSDSNLAKPASLVPPSIKPTSRARTYRIPNTSDAGNVGAVVTDSGGNHVHSTAPESFLWATREIAALDFLMNVPLRLEKDIVRAGLSGGRWNRHSDKQHGDSYSDRNKVGFSSGVEVIEEDKYLDSPANNQTLSSFDVTRSSGIDEEATTTGTESSVHTMSLASEHIKHHTAAGGRWWEKLIMKDKRFFSAANQQVERREQLELEEKELERPTESPSLVMMNSAAVDGSAAGNKQGYFGSNAATVPTPPSAAAAGGVPGRRLDGRDAVTIAVPGEFRIRPPPPRAVARQAAVREWEIGVAYGAQQDRKQLGNNVTPRNSLLDGRLFFSTRRSYPVAVFSTIKYEPKKEETLRRRKQLEELGGGGTRFVLPERDWRGISHRSLLPQGEKQSKQGKAFNRLLRGNTSPQEKGPKISASPRERTHFGNTSSSEEDNEENSSLSSSEESDEYEAYFPGFLDDPEMVQGRNRNVMMGDKVTGPIISSTIQFVKPSVLKADLNKQFRERFDQWEPPKARRRYIGARVIDGEYTLIDPTETIQEDDVDGGRLWSASVTTEHERETIRMPPSLTLSKIRSLKQQALVACLRARIEISTLALACIHFERLCLDCRVDKSNRRLSFAACLLLAAKVNESNSMIAYDRGVETKSDVSLPLMTSRVQPNKKSGKIFESLVVFFTHEWSLSLKQLYAAEWIVFTALGFSLKAKPSEVAFHFKRLLRVLEWNPRSYLGHEMYRQWQESLAEESHQNNRRKAKREQRIKRNERKLLKLQRKLHLQQSEDASKSSSRRSSATHSDGGHSGTCTFRRHSVDSALLPVGENRSFGNERHSISSTPHSIGPPEKSHQEEPDSPGRLLRNVKKPEGAAIRGILSRLTRPKQVSHGKELDKLPVERKTACSMKQSLSVPNLTSFDSKRNDLAMEFDVLEGDSESCQSDKPNREEDGLFV